jgi:hypothetical protein
VFIIDKAELPGGAVISGHVARARSQPCPWTRRGFRGRLPS